MIQYISNTGGGKKVDFETAILDGFAEDGGLYVPEYLPKITLSQLTSWSNLSYIELAQKILSLFIDESVMTAEELADLLKKAYESFEKEEIIPLYPLKTRKDTYIMELFYGPTISFKDIGLAFLVNLVDFFLSRKGARKSIIVATTGDTGPATAHFVAGKPSLDAWVLYPKGMITEAQERQMTTITANNVHPVGVKNCPDGGDDLDIVVANLFADKAFKDKLNLSSVNSINWGRILMQTVHYFYGYLQVVNRVGEEVNMAVPSGAFGNLCAGNIARKMGLPVATFVCSNNENACLHRIFSEGLFAKRPIIETISSAIDILIPYNFWRYLYFVTGEDPKKIKDWIAIFKEKGELQFDEESRQQLQAGIQSKSISDAQTLATIRTIYEKEVYLLDPHAAVAVAAAEALKSELGNKKMICLATAHPAKFPDTIQRALGGILPQSGQHTSIEIAKKRCEKLRICDHSHFEEALVHAMEQHWDSITKK